MNNHRYPTVYVPGIGPVQPEGDGFVGFCENGQGWQDYPTCQCEGHPWYFSVECTMEEYLDALASGQAYRASNYDMGHLSPDVIAALDRRDAIRKAINN